MQLRSRSRSEAPHADDPGVGVVIITGSCCIPGMRPFDEQARRVVEQAIAQAGVPAQLKELPASNALLGGVPKQVLAGLMARFNEGGQIGLPAVLVNGEVVSYGVPRIETVTAALLAVGQATTAANTPETPAEPGTETEHVHG
jgi:hypothetical protein